MHKGLADAWAADAARRAENARRTARLANSSHPLARLRHHVSGAIARGEAEAIEGKDA